MGNSSMRTRRRADHPDRRGDCWAAGGQRRSGGVGCGRKRLGSCVPGGGQRYAAPRRIVSVRSQPTRRRNQLRRRGPPGICIRPDLDISVSGMRRLRHIGHLRPRQLPCHVRRRPVESAGRAPHMQTRGGAGAATTAGTPRRPRWSPHDALTCPARQPDARPQSSPCAAAWPAVHRVAALPTPARTCLSLPRRVRARKGAQSSRPDGKPLPARPRRGLSARRFGGVGTPPSSR